MNSPRKPNSSYFGPRQHTSTRLKTNGLSLRKSEGRFRTKLDKEWRKHQAQMKCMNRSKSNRNAMPNHHIKTSRASLCQTHLKAMPNLIHKEKNVATPNLNNGALGSRRRGQSNSYKGEDINVGKEGTKTSEILKSREVSRKKSNIPVVNQMDANKGEPNKVKESLDEVVTKEGMKGHTCEDRAACSNWMDPNKDELNKAKGRLDEVVTKERMKGHTCEGRAACGNRHKQMNTTKTNDAQKKHMQGLGSNLRDNPFHLFGNHSGHQRDDPFIEVNSGAIFSSKHVLSCEHRETNVKLPNRVQSVGGNGKTNDVISRGRKQPLLEEKSSTHVQKDLTCRLMKRRRYIEANEDEEGNVGDQHPAHIEDVTTVLTPQVSISKHCVERQCYCCSKPIDIPRWRYS